jgi:erythrocyte band 7 integral membrane protein
MAKSANSKVVFVPMQLQSDVSSQLGGASGSGLGAIVPNESAMNEGSLGSASRVGILNSVADM